MGPVQYVYLSIAIIFALIGLSRGYDKELGNSIILMITMAVLGFVDARYETNSPNLAGRVFGVHNTGTFLFLLYSLVFMVVVFSSYSGVTLNYGGTPSPGLGERLISLASAFSTGI